MRARRRGAGKAKGTMVGLDIGRHAVKAAWVRASGRRYSLARVETLRLPADLREHRDVIRSWVEKIGLTGTPCALGLSGQYCMFQPITMAGDDVRTYEQVAAMEVLQFNDMAAETMVYGFAPFQLRGDDRRLMLAMARPAVLDAALELGRDVGIRPVELVPGPAALCNAVRALSPDTEEGTTLYVNVGKSGTEMAVGSAHGLLFARSFGSGGQMFTEALMRQRNVPLAEAETLKVKNGTLAGDTPEAKILSSAADVWISELTSCLSVYRSLYPESGHQPQRVVLVGQASLLDGFSEFVGEKLSIPVAPAPMAMGAARDASPATFAAAIGLAVSALGAPPVSLSVLPSGVRDELMFRKQKPCWIGAAVVGALILAVSLVGGYRDFKRKEAVLQRQKISLGRRQQLGSEIEDIKTGTRMMFSMVQPVDRLVRTGPMMRDLITALSDSISQRDWLRLVCDAESYFWYEPVLDTPAEKRGMRDDRRRDTRKPPRENEYVDRSIIEGYTRDRDLTTVKDLIATLTAHGFIASADLLSDDQLMAQPDETSGMGARRRRFVIDVRMKQP